MSSEGWDSRSVSITASENANVQVGNRNIRVNSGNTSSTVTYNYGQTPAGDQEKVPAPPVRTQPESVRGKRAVEELMRKIEKLGNEGQVSPMFSALRGIFAYLCDNTTSSDPFADQLFSLGALLKNERDIVRAEGTPYNKNEKIYNSILIKGKAVEMVTALELSENHHVINEILLHLFV